MKKPNSIRITKEGKNRIEQLTNHILVDQYHKTLLKAIQSRIPKNLSKSDCDIFKTISDQYKARGI